MNDGSLGGIGDVGEILLKRPFNIIDYLNDEKQTKELIDTDLWIHSGDMGYFNDSLNLFIVGRKKFLIRCCDHQVNPAEIEAIIEDLPGVLKACVVAVPDDDSYELPCAVIEKTDCSTTEADIKEAVGRNLEDFKQLNGGIFFIDKLPLTATGKLNRNLIEKIALSLTKNC